MSRHSVQNTGLVTNICAVKKEFWILQLVGKISYFFRCLLFLLPKKVTRRLLFYFWVLLISKNCTVFENYSKCRIWIFQLWLVPPIFILPISYLSGNTTWPQLRFSKIDHFWHFSWTFVNSKCKLSSLRSLTIFCLIKSDLSGNTVWPQARQYRQFLEFLMNFCPLKM